MENADVKVDNQHLVNLILGNIADGVFTVDSRFRITFFNPAAEQITGYKSSEVIGEYCHKVFRTPICSQTCPLRQSIRTGRAVKNFEIDILLRHGKKQTISVSTAPLIDENGKFLGGVETFRDLTTIKELRKEISSGYTFQDIISKNAKMRQIFQTLPNIAQSDATVLLQGRSGTGKELFATAIHNLSPRSNGPLVTVNCGAIPEQLLESELFGHVKGAFTDAKQDRAGRFKTAEGGSILLDEIGDTPLSLQVKLLRVLEQREYQPLGAETTEKADVRVIAATNQDLDTLVSEGKFREDLFYRLNVILIQIPDLRERKEDISLLIDHFIARFNQRMGRSITGVTDNVINVLMRYDYPGNVRELENILEHAYIISSGPYISIDDLPPHLTQKKQAVFQARPPIFSSSGSLESEKDRISECLKRNYYSIPKAAQEMNIHRTTLWRKVKKLGIEIP
jgi:PAS domain S-box-containing protein